MSIVNSVYVALPSPSAFQLRLAPSPDGCSNAGPATLVCSSCSTSGLAHTALSDFVSYSGRLPCASSGFRGINRDSRKWQRLNSKQKANYGSSCCCQSQTDRSDGQNPNSNEGFNNEQSEITENSREGQAKDDEKQDSQEDKGSFGSLSEHGMRMHATVARLGDPLRDIKPQESERDRWREVFADADEQENLASVLRFQLEEAVENEDFQEAVRLKLAVSAVEAKNTVAEVFNELKIALDEERYSDAARLRDEAGAGLVGWWSGISDGGNDPFGQIVNISPAQGRLMARSYTARQLITGAPGIPLFEVFITKDEHGIYSQQAVCLRRNGRRGTNGPVKIDVISKKATGNQSQEVIKEALEVVEDGKEPGKDIELSGETLSHLLSFLKDKIPDVKLKVVQVIAPEGTEADIAKIVRQFVEQEQEGKETEKSLPGDQDSSEIKEIAIEIETEVSDVQSEVRSTDSHSEDVPLSVIVSAGKESSLDDKLPTLPERVLARIEHKTKDMFVIHVEDSNKDGIAASSAAQALLLAAKSGVTSAASDSADIVKISTNSERVPVKVLTEMGELIKLAVSHAQRKWGLSSTTSYSRVDVAAASNDPLNGLYVGAFGPYTSEVVELRRNFGHWQEDNSITCSDKVDFFEYVEAVKLTGDLSVPAGQVTFRAKVGKMNRLSHHFVYPDELGVIARYKGQGRMAEPGFQNPQWVDGELVLLRKKSGGLSNGAELGFVYSINDRHILVLFNRLNLRN